MAYWGSLNLPTETALISESWFWEEGVCVALFLSMMTLVSFKVSGVAAALIDICASTYTSGIASSYLLASSLTELDRASSENFFLNLRNFIDLLLKHPIYFLLLSFITVLF